MKINFLNFKEMEDYNKTIIISGMFFFMLSIFIITILFNYDFYFYNTETLILTYGLYFLLNYLGFMMILTQLNKTIKKYKEQIISLNSANLILESDKRELFKKLKGEKK